MSKIAPFFKIFENYSCHKLFFIFYYSVYLVKAYYPYKIIAKKKSLFILFIFLKFSWAIFNEKGGAIFWIVRPWWGILWTLYLNNINQYVIN